MPSTASNQNAASIRFAACLLALAGSPCLIQAQQGLSLSDRDVSVSYGDWFHIGNMTGIAPGTVLELKGPNTRLTWVPDMFIDGTLIIKDGATLDLHPGDGLYNFGLNLYRKRDVDTVVDISGRGSSLIAQSTGKDVQELVIGGRARSTTLNISNGGSFVFDHPNFNSYIHIASPDYFGPENDLTVNVTGAGSRMALLTHHNGTNWEDVGVWKHGPTFAMSRGGLIDLGPVAVNVVSTRLRFTIGDDGTGKVASGMFRLRTPFFSGTDFGLSVAPCTTLRAGDQFLLVEYGWAFSGGVLLAQRGLDWRNDQGEVSYLPSGGLYTSGGYTFSIQYEVDLGHTFAGGDYPAKGIVATVVAVPLTAAGASCGKVGVSLTSNAPVPFTVTGAGCEPGLYWGAQTLLTDAYSTCRVAHYAFTPSPDGTGQKFVDWQDGVTSPVRAISVGNTASAWYANTKTQYKLDISGSPSDGGTVQGSGYYDPGTTVKVGAVPGPAFIFSHWVGAVSAPSKADTTVTLSSPISVQAMLFQVKSRPSISVTDTSGVRYQTVKIKATLSVDRWPMFLPAGNLWGELRFELAGKLIGMAAVFGPGTFEVDYFVPNVDTLSWGQHPVRVIFTPTTGTSPVMVGSTGWGTFGNRIPSN